MTTQEMQRLAAKHTLEHALKALERGDYEAAIGKARMASAYMRDLMEAAEANRT